MLNILLVLILPNFYSYLIRLTGLVSVSVSQSLVSVLQDMFGLGLGLTVSGLGLSLGLTVLWSR